MDTELEKLKDDFFVTEVHLSKNQVRRIVYAIQHMCVKENIKGEKRKEFDEIVKYLMRKVIYQKG